MSTQVRHGARALLPRAGLMLLLGAQSTLVLVGREGAALVLLGVTTLLTGVQLARAILALRGAMEEERAFREATPHYAASAALLEQRWEAARPWAIPRDLWRVWGLLFGWC